MSERHTVHLADGSKVVVDGDRYEVYLARPLTFRRGDWICWFSPEDEARRTAHAVSYEQPILDALAAAFRAIPQIVHPED